MQHRPTSTHASGRTWAGRRRRERLRTSAAPRRRLALGVLALALVTGFVLAAPVVAGPGSPSRLALDSAPDARAGASPIVMGLDGRPTSSTFAGAHARLTMGEDGLRVEPPTSRSERMVPSAVPPAPAVAEAPAPAADAVPTPAPTPVEAPAVAPAPAPSPAPSAAPGPVASRAAAPAPAPAPAPPAPAAPAPAASDRAGQVLALVNEARAAAGCRPVSADPGLAGVATAHSADMRDRGYFDHVNLAGESPFDRASAAGVSARAENIARGQADAAAVMDSWMTSTGHRSNILDCSLTRLGVGIADGGGGPWWTQLFG